MDTDNANADTAASQYDDILTCSQKGCDEPAAVKYHWMSEPMLACIDHAATAQNIGNAMGINIHFEPINPMPPDNR